MKILVLDRPGPQTTPERVTPLLPAETLHLWKAYSGDVVREMYFRRDRMGVVLVLECESLEEAQRHMSEFPLARAGVIEFELIPIGPFVGLGSLFAPAPEQAV